jgi:hypothetical protein
VEALSLSAWWSARESVGEVRESERERERESGRGVRVKVL